MLEQRKHSLPLRTPPCGDAHTLVDGDPSLGTIYIVGQTHFPSLHDAKEAPINLPVVFDSQLRVYYRLRSLGIKTVFTESLGCRDGQLEFDSVSAKITLKMCSVRDIARVESGRELIAEGIPPTNLDRALEIVFPKLSSFSEYDARQRYWFSRIGGAAVYSFHNPEVAILPASGEAGMAGMQLLSDIGAKRDAGLVRELNPLLDQLDRIGIQQEKQTFARIMRYLALHRGQSVALVFGVDHEFRGLTEDATVKMPRILRADALPEEVADSLRAVAGATKP